MPPCQISFHPACPHGFLMFVCMFDILDCELMKLTNFTTVGGGFEYLLFLLFSPLKSGKMNPIWRYNIFQMGGNQHTNQLDPTFYLSLNWRNILHLKFGKQQLFPPRGWPESVPPGGHFGCVLLRRHGGQYVRETPTLVMERWWLIQMVQVLLFAGTEKKVI